VPTTPARSPQPEGSSCTVAETEVVEPENALAPQGTITPPASSVDLDGIPVGAECAVAELAPSGGADGPAVVEPGSVVVSSGDRVTVTATNTFTASSRPRRRWCCGHGVAGVGAHTAPPDAAAGRAYGVNVTPR
jgi:hypothetical protein